MVLVMALAYERVAWLRGSIWVPSFAAIHIRYLSSPLVWILAWQILGPALYMVLITIHCNGKENAPKDHVYDVTGSSV